MPIAYQDLNPISSEIIIDNRSYELRPFDLAAQVWAHNFFAKETEENGVTVLAERIQDLNDFTAVLSVTWHLLKEKSKFDNDENKFNKAIEKLDDKYMAVMMFRQAIVQCLGVSQPKLDEMQEELELKKSLAKEK